MVPKKNLPLNIIIHPFNLLALLKMRNFLSKTQTSIKIEKRRIIIIVVFVINMFIKISFCELSNKTYIILS